MCQRIYGALSRLSYGAVICIKVAPVGFELTTSGSLGMYSNSAVDRCLLVVSIAAEGEGVEPSRPVSQARPASNRVPSPFGLPFRYVIQ